MDPTIQKKVEMLQHIFTATTVYFHYWWFWVALIIGLIFSMMPIASANDEELDSWSTSTLFLWIPVYFLLMFSFFMWEIGIPIINNYSPNINGSDIFMLFVMGTIGAMAMFWRFPKRPLPAIIFMLTLLVWPLLNELIFPSGAPVNALFIKGMWIISVEFLVITVNVVLTATFGEFLAVFGGMFMESSTEQTENTDVIQKELARRKKRTKQALNIIQMSESFIMAVGFSTFFVNKSAILFVHPIENYLLKITVLLLSVRVLWPTIKAISKYIVRIWYDRTDKSASDETNNSAADKTDQSVDDDIDNSAVKARKD